MRLQFMATVYEGIALSGGGYNAFSHLGALACLEDLGQLDKVSTVAGSSAGAVVATLALLNDMKCMRGLLETYAGKSLMTPLRQQNPLANYGFISPAYELLADRVKERLGRPDATLGDLRRATSRRLIVPAYRVRDGKTRVLPEELSILSSIRATTAIPIIMTPVRVGEHLYVDGGIGAYVPLKALAAAGVPPERSLGVSLEASDGRPAEIRDAGGYLAALAAGVIQALDEERSRDEPACVLRVKHPPAGLFGLVPPTYENAQALFACGYAAMRELHRNPTRL